ncbi:MAG: hypothetical protein R3B97_11835 [Dehalococcoidia bacterium]|nr:hypothetical protein [Dehalococcoidia bacterium]MCB9484638.1 hypothetical protein [Thermoflexaceae bacterium]
MNRRAKPFLPALVIVVLAVTVLPLAVAAGASSSLPARSVIPFLSADTAGGRSLDITADAGVTKQVVDRYFSPYRYGPTQIFYVLAEDAAMVRVQFPADSTDFRFSVTVYLFEDGTTADRIGQFVNNLHSDALYPDPPRPTSQTTIPASALVVLASDLTGHTVGSQGDEYDDYAVKFQVDAHVQPGLFSLAAFDSVVGVHVRTCDLEGCPG